MQTDEQITDRLATEIMEWKRSGMYWLCAGGSIMAHVNTFKPLRNHNHMAWPREKMREKGWKRLTQDELIGTFSVTYIYPNPWKSFSSLSQNDDLMAEALAILEAAGKEGKT